MKLARKEYDEISAVLIRYARELNPSFTENNLRRIFGRTYSNLLKSNKLSKEVDEHEKQDK